MYIMEIRISVFTNLFKGDKKMAENSKFSNFKKEYNELLDYVIKQVGTVVRDRKNFDKDELLGMATVLTVKLTSFMNSTMNLIEWEEESLSKLLECEEKAYTERSEIRKYLAHLDTKLDGIDEKLKAQEESNKKVKKEEK